MSRTNHGCNNSNAGGVGLRKGSWTEEEDRLLRKYVDKFGEGNWKHIPTKAGLNRCRKSCRLRWLNYLRPNIKRGDFTADEDDIILRLHRLLGNRWSLIAGRIPGRTANDIKNYWNSCLSKKTINASDESKRLASSLDSGKYYATTASDNTTCAINSEPSDGDLRSSSGQKTDGEEEEEEEAGEDTASFWRSLLMEVGDDDCFQGLGDLVQDMGILGGHE